MCGIIGYTGKGDPKEILLDGLKRLEYRGYDSAGIAIVESRGVQVTRCEGPIAALEAKLSTHHYEGSVGIGHTRWATHGAPSEINAHPHRAGVVTLVHNGIIENYLEHKAQLQAEGIRTVSDTDSEIVAHLLNREIERGASLRQALRLVLPQLRGFYAFVVLSDKEPDSLVGVRNGVQLLLGVGKEGNYLTSDVQAILHRTNKIRFLNDGEIVECNEEKVQITDINGTRLPLEVQTLEWNAEQSNKGGFRHYMLKEIQEQPQAIAQTIEGNIDHALGVISLSGLAPYRDSIEKIKRITLVACGTARHSALVAKYYFGRYANLPVDVDFGLEFRYRNPNLEPGTLLVLVSQSGETADTLGALRAGKAKGVPTLSVCNVRESSLARESDVILYTNAGPEIGVASTKAFTTQLTILYMLAVEMGFLKGHLSLEQARALSNDLLHLPQLVEQTLKSEKQIEQFAFEQQNRNLFLFLGRGVNYPIALEGALKLKEITYLHAEGYPAGELKHGPIALIDTNTCAFALAAKDAPDGQAFEEANHSVYEKLMSNLQEAKSRGAQLYCIASEQEAPSPEQAKVLVSLPSASWGLNPILQSVPLQLFAYYMALHRGTDMDKPRNLAKSVTVE